MKLESLTVESLPGLAQRLAIDDLGPGVNVVLGPNASGKSSIMRALLAALYPHDYPGAVSARVELLDRSGAVVCVQRLGDSVAWESGGAPCQPPPLPPHHLIGSYLLRLEDLLGPDAESASGRGRRGRSATTDGNALDAHIAQRIAKELTGGIDLKAVRHSIGSQTEKGRKLAGELKEALTQHAELRRSRTELHGKQQRLAQWRAQLELEREAAHRRNAVEDAKRLLDAHVSLSEARARLSAYPPAIEALVGTELDELSEARRALEVAGHDIARLDRDVAEMTSALAAIDLPADVAPESAALALDRADALVGLQEKRAAKAREVASARAQLADAWRRMGGEPGEGPPVGRESVTVAGDGHPAAAATASDAAAAVSVASDAAATISHPADAAAAVSDADLEAVERLMEERQAARVAVAELRRQLLHARLAETATDDATVANGDGGTAAARVEALRRAHAEASRWLQEPPLEPRRPAWAWAVALGLTAALVTAGALQASLSWLLTMAAGVAAWLLALRLLIPPLISPVKTRIERELGSSPDLAGVDLPRSWDHVAVGSLLLAVGKEIERLERAVREREAAGERCRNLEAEVAQAEEREARAQAAITDARRRHGFTLGPDAKLSSWLQALRDVARVRAELRGLLSELDALDRQASELHQRLADHLGLPERPAGALALRSLCRDRLRLAQERQAATAELGRLRRERRRATEEVEAQRAKIAALFARAGIEVGEAARRADDPEAIAAAPKAIDAPEFLDAALEPAAERRLRALVESLGAWRRDRERRAGDERLVEELSQRLGQHESLLEAAKAHDAAALAEALAAAEDARRRADDLTKLIHETDRDIERAAGERRLQQAAAAVQRATDDLETHRQEALRLAAANFMLSAVEEEHESAGRPAALERAARWFAAFTHGSFELRFEADGGGERRLGARDLRDGSGGRVLELAELSTGTRAQLLLASRLAFALETERDGCGLPFFLDEALTTSDPERFEQVALALLTAARLDGRQFIHLSARPDDAELWRRVASAHGDGIELIEDLSRVARARAAPRRPGGERLAGRRPPPGCRWRR